jgi:kumamolisin
MHIDIVLPVRDEAELGDLVQQLNDRSSTSYHKFLTPADFTLKFGPSQEQWDALVAFAKANGFEIVSGSRDAMDLRLIGTVASIEQAFHVVVGVYQHPTEDRTFYAIDREPTVDLPFQLWHISGLDNYSIPHPMFVKKSQSSNAELHVHPLATTGSCPSASFCGSDMRAAYYGGTLTGTGQNVALFEYEGTDLADLTTYYKNAGQTEPFTPTLISTDGTSTSCTEKSGSCDDTEQTLDMTQAMGMAPGMTMLYMYVGSTDTAIISAMTVTTDAPLSKQISCSWGWTPADASTLDPYFEKMASQGQNFFAASGDSSTWSSSNEAWPADDANVVSVGGTDLTTASAGGAWSSETAWSDSGGGISPDSIAIPSWQTSYINFSTCTSCSKTLRNGPDVSANANFTFYVCADQTTCTANDYGGTSFAAPMWAGYLALANQQAAANGDTIGFIDPLIYAAAAGSSYSTLFHDITSGTSGSYSATKGYDLVTGWGSPNGAGLINLLAPASSSPNFTISASPTTVSVQQGNNGTSTITTAVSGGFDSAIALSATGQPTGVTVSFSPTSIAAPGSGTSTMTMAVASTTATGTYTITVSGNGDSITNTTTVTLTVTAAPVPSFTLTASPTSVSVVQGNNGTSTITTAVSGGFDSAIALSATGQPTGVTVSFSPTSIAAPGSGTSTMTMAVASTTATGTYTITVSGTGDSITHTATVALTVTSAPVAGFTVSASPTSLTVLQGSKGTSTITVTSQNSFNSATTLSATGLPSGVTAAFSTNPVTPPANGSATSTLTLTASSTATLGTATITVTGTSGSLSNSASIALTVSASTGAVQATGSFVFSSVPTKDAITNCSDAELLLGGRVYTFILPSHWPTYYDGYCTTEVNVLIGTTVANTAQNLAVAINNSGTCGTTAGGNGSCYYDYKVSGGNGYVTAAASAGKVTLTAIPVGTAGNCAYTCTSWTNCECFDTSYGAESNLGWVTDAEVSYIPITNNYGPLSGGENASVLSAVTWFHQLPSTESGGVK